MDKNSKGRMNIHTLFKELHNTLGRHRSTIVALCAIVVFCTTYILILPAFTLDADEARTQGGIDVPAAAQEAGDNTGSTAAGKSDANSGKAGSSGTSADSGQTGNTAESKQTNTDNNTEQSSDDNGDDLQSSNTGTDSPAVTPRAKAKAAATSDISADKNYVLYIEKNGKYYVITPVFANGQAYLSAQELAVSNKLEDSLNAVSLDSQWTIEKKNWSNENMQAYAVRSVQDSAYTIGLWGGIFLGSNSNDFGIVQNGDGYTFKGWSGGGSRQLYLNDSLQLEGSINYSSKVYIWEQDYYHFTVETSDPSMGTVSGKTVNGTEIKNEASFETRSKTSSDDYKNDTGIEAKANDGYVFDHWELNGTTVSYEKKISNKTLQIPYSGSVLKAVFRSTGSSQTDNNDQYIKEIEEELAEWAQGMTSDSVAVDKSAQVYDYTNRIYEVNLSASSGVRRVVPSIDLEFIVDISRSMYFPATLNPVTTFTQGTEHATYNDMTLYNWLTTYGDKDTVYYVVGADSAATVTAVYYGGRAKNPADAVTDTKWRYVDSSNFNAPDGTNYAGKEVTAQGGTIDYFGKYATGTLYTADGSLRRQDYLVAAVKSVAEVLYAIDPDARIGLVTFYKEAQNRGFFTKDQKDEFITTITTVTLDGGTNQQLGIETGTGLFENNNKKKTAILITDGAPNQSGVTWDTINTAANSLKNKYGTNSIDLYTLGLSLSMVGEENRTGLKNIATGSDYHFAAESGMDVLTAMEKMIEKIIDEASLKGTVTDTIDEVFYPVTKDGTRLEAGDKINLAGEKTTDTSKPYGTVQYDSATDTYSVVWSDQSIPYTSSGTGWSGKVYVKAREDFLGGNTIKTNGGLNDKFTATHYIVNNTEYPVEAGKTIEASFETPYVNVDELKLDQHNTEWTVYLGTDVEPITDIKELFNIIKVSEVVSAEDSDHRRSSGSKLVTDPGFEPNTFLISTLTGSLSEDQWTTLRTTGKLTIPYTKYNDSRYGDDNVGNIVITLTKDGTGSDYANHTTTVTGTPAETYTLKVEYQPSAVNTVPEYHTTTGGSAGNPTGTMTSTNVHKINVFAKGLQVTKKDQTFEKELTGAEFVLYRTARDSDSDNDKVDLSGLTGKYVAVTTLDMTTSSTASVDKVTRLAENEQYYLVETKAPAGYNMLTEPIQVRLTISDSYTTVPTVAGAQPSTVRPTGTPYNWTETATLTIDTTSGKVHMTDASGNNITGTGITPDSETDKVYYDIANDAGIELPSTGGPGTTLFYIIGAILIITAVALSIRRRRIN